MDPTLVALPIVAKASPTLAAAGRIRRHAIVKRPMPADRSKSPIWYRPPEGDPAPPSTPGAPVTVDDEPSTWVRPEPVYYHGPSTDDEPGAPPEVPAETPETPPEVPPETPPEAPPETPSETPSTAAAEAQLSPPDPAEAKRPRRKARTVACIALILVVMGAMAAGASQIFGWFHSSHSITVPAKIGGQSLLGSTPAIRQTLMSQGWTGVQTGLYGTGGVTQTLLVVGRPPSGIAGGDAFLPGVTADLLQQGYVTNPNNATSAGGVGTELFCGPVATANGEAAMCAWIDGDAAGVVVDFSGAALEQTRSLALLARGASEH